MNAVLVVVVTLLVVLALVVGGTGVLALAAKLPGNGYLGVRTPETRESPEAWELANRAAGPAFLTAGIALLLGALGAGLIGGWVGGIVVVVALIGALALLNVAGLAGARAAAIWKATREPEAGGCGCGPDGCGGHTDPGATGTDSPACSTGDSGGTCATHSDPAADPSADCGVTGGCGTCVLQGMCEPENATTT